MSQETRLITSQSRLQYWSEVFADRKQSGMKVDDYCQQNNISHDQYYYWLRKVRESAVDSMPCFAELKKPTSSSAFSDAEIFVPELTLRINNIVVSVNRSTDMQLLKRTLELIQNA